MTLRLLLVFGFLAFALPGCDNKGGSTAVKPPASSKPDEDDHEHGAGPHKGTVFDLGKYHAELCIEHKTMECSVYILAGNAKDAVAVACKELTVTTLPVKLKDGKEVPAMKIKLLPKDASMGKATTFVGTDPGLANEAEYAGSVAGEINGKPSEGKFEEK